MTYTSNPSERFTLTIPRSLKRQLDAAVPSRQRSAFTAKAIEDALKAKARQEALAMTKGLTANPTKGEDSVAVLQQYREQFSGKSSNT